MGTAAAGAPNGAKLVYWRRELPPLADEADGDYVVEATSEVVPLHRSDPETRWRSAQASLRREAERRIAAEVRRLGGKYAHVLDEQVRERIDHAHATYALAGRYRFVLYPAPPAAHVPP